MRSQLGLAWDGPTSSQPPERHPQGSAGPSAAPLGRQLMGNKRQRDGGGAKSKQGRYEETPRTGRRWRRRRSRCWSRHSLQPEEGPTTEQTDSSRGTAAPGQLEQVSLEGCSPGQSLQGTRRNQDKSRRGRSHHEPPGSPVRKGRGRRLCRAGTKLRTGQQKRKAVLTFLLLPTRIYFDCQHTN